MPGQDVQDHARGMDVVGQCFCARGFDRINPIAQHSAQYIDHLPVTAGLAFQLALHAPQGNRKIPFLEGRAVAQSAWFANQNRDVVKRIIDCLVASEGACMAANDPAILPTFHPVGIGADLHGPSHRTGIDGVPVLIEPHEAGL